MILPIAPPEANILLCWKNHSKILLEIYKRSEFFLRFERVMVWGMMSPTGLIHLPVKPIFLVASGISYHNVAVSSTCAEHRFLRLGKGNQLEAALTPLHILVSSPAFMSQNLAAWFPAAVTSLRSPGTQPTGRQIPVRLPLFEALLSASLWFRIVQPTTACSLAAANICSILGAEEKEHTKGETETHVSPEEVCSSCEVHW